MAFLLVYKVGDERIVLGLPNQDVAPPKSDFVLRLQLREEDFDFRLVPEADLDALGVVDDDGRVHVDLLKLKGGVLSANPAYDPSRAAKLANKAAKRAERKQAKSDARVAAFAAMTQQDWMNLSANERWQTLFAVLKANINE